MDYFETVRKRRSIRKYTGKDVPDEVVEKALEAALLAPNSSNLQTWEFYWVQSEEKRTKLIEACLDQNAARTSKHLVVVVANPKLWKKHQQALLATFEAAKSPPIVFQYYQKVVPMLYGWPMLSWLRWIVFNVIGLFKPVTRRPWSTRDIDEISIKSAALASENFMLAVTAQGFDSCPMEGFDERRVKKILNLACRSRVVMVISVGDRDPKGVWGEQYRVPKDWVVFKV